MLLPTRLHTLPYCNTIAPPLRNIHPPTPTPPFYALHHTILGMTISCEGQAEFGRCVGDRAGFVSPLIDTGGRDCV